MITSNQNSKIKFVRTLLSRSKERREVGLFVAEGVRLLEEALIGDWNFETVFYDETLSERGKSLISNLESRNIEIEEVSVSVMKSISETENPQGILAILKFSQFPIPESPNFILIPDQIRDPGNLGTLLRSAIATGVQAVLIPPETTDAFAPKVLRAGMGAHFKLPIHEMSWEEIGKVLGASHLEEINESNPSSATHSGLQVLIADMDGQPCWEMDLKSPLALIIGGEADGVSEEAKKIANGKISIPMAGDIESLNAGVAGSVLMFEVLRQRTNHESSIA